MANLDGDPKPAAAKLPFSPESVMVQHRRAGMCLLERCSYAVLPWEASYSHDP